MSYANLGISSAKRESMGVWGRSPQRGAGAEPLLIGVGDGRVVCMWLCVVLCLVVFVLCVVCGLMYVFSVYSLTGSVMSGRTAPDESATALAVAVR